MIREIAADGNATFWSIVSLLFFVTVFAFVVVRLVRMRKSDADAQARLPLDDGSPGDEEGPGRKARGRDEA